MELITFVDENDNIIGAGTKREAWDKGIANRIARVFLLNSKGELLIQKRGENIVSLPGRFDQSAAGHADEGETYLQAAKRELFEEVGVSGVELREITKIFTNETDESDKIKKRFNMLYEVVYDGEIKMDPGELAEVRWIMPEKLDKMMKEKSDDFTQGFLESFRKFYELKRK